MNHPIDQPNRERFVFELDKNFSVVAAAGSGKTRAITDRIVQIAKSEQARDRLPQLVVVAFTNRAADLSPDDIETLTVLKGPEASALYGIDAANGAIVITTKRGRSGGGRACSEHRRHQPIGCSAFLCRFRSSRLAWHRYWSYRKNSRERASAATESRV